MKTSTTRLLAFTTLVAILTAPSFFAADFANGGFETGTFDGWVQSGGYWFGGTNYPANYIYSNAPFQSAVVGPLDPTNVPCLWTKGVNIAQVRNGLYSARINSNDKLYNPGGLAMRHFSQIQQVVPAWNSPYFSFEWSAVLEDSGHDRPNRPHFRVIFEDLTKGTTNCNMVYYSDTLPPAIVQTTGPGTEDWAYTDWHHVQINTTGMSNDTVRLTILASDCSETGHDGALYVDNVMGTPLTGFDLPVAVPSAGPNRAPTGTLVMLDGGGSHNTNNLAMDLYDWDLNGDGVTDLSGGATQTWTIPATWAPGTYTLNLRVREQLPSPPSPITSQWSPWAPVTLTVIGPPDAPHSTLSPATASILADGKHTKVITVQARDVAGNILTTGGQTVVFSLLSGTGAISSTTDNGNGTYTAKVYSPTAPGSGTFGATMGGVPVGTAVGAVQSVVTYFLPPYLSAALTSTNTVVISWPLSETGWQLQATTELPASGTSWTGLSYQTNGATCFHIESTPTGSQFYRLTLP